MAPASVTAVRTPAPDPRPRLLALAAVLLLAGVAVGYQLAAGAAITDLAATLAVAASFIGTGFYAWARRPDNRIGPLMALLGVGFLLLLFGGSIPLRPIVLLGFTIQGTLLAYLILAFPSGILGTTTNRALVALTAVLQFVSRGILFVTDDPALRGSDQVNPYLLYSDAEFVRAYEPIPALLDVGLLVLFIAIAIVRWARATGPARRVYTPVAVATVGLLSLILVDAIVSLTRRPGRSARTPSRTCPWSVGSPSRSPSSSVSCGCGWRARPSPTSSSSWATRRRRNGCATRWRTRWAIDRWSSGTGRRRQARTSTRRDGRCRCRPRARVGR